MSLPGNLPSPSASSAMRTGSPLRVCFVLSYRDPDYIRGRALCEAIRRIPGVELLQAVNSSRGIARYWETLRRLAAVRKQWHPDVYLLGFRGHEIALATRWLAGGKPLVFDALVSPYAALCKEHKHGATGRFIAPIVRLLEKSVLRCVDVVLTDTQLHLDYYRDAFHLGSDKLAAIPVGAVEMLPVESHRANDDSPFTVLFYGSFLPLHGIDVVLEAAARVSELPVVFHFIGGSPKHVRRLHAACTARGVRNYTHRAWVPFDRLLQEDIPAADLCLGGPFGGTWQGRRVVTGKTSQCMAMAKPTVVGRIDEDYGFRDRENCFLVDQADPAGLADAIRWAFLNRSSLHDIGERGRGLYLARLSVDVIAGRMADLLRRFQPESPDS